MRQRFKQWRQTIKIKKGWVIGAIATTAVVIGGFGGWLWLLPNGRLQPNDRTLSTNERTTLAYPYRGTLIVSIGAIATVVGGVVLYRNFRVAKRKAKRAEARLISERFAKAVEQLGHEESIHIRLGGIDALGRLAEDSDEMHKPVLNVLSAFIRKKHSKKKFGSKNSNKDSQTPLQSLAIDVKAALTVIWERKRDIDFIDLSETAFNSTVLSGVNFSGANLHQANLSGANLSSTNLSGVNFSGANLNGANLHQANLSGVNLIFTNLSGANFNGANLRQANLSGADLSFADLSGANLFSANLSRADLLFANLSRADLRCTILIFTNLSGVNLSRADLHDALLLATDLRSAQNLTSQQLQGDALTFLCNTALPPDLTESSMNANEHCDRIPQLLSKRSGVSLKVAQKVVNDTRQKQWDEASREESE